MGSNIFGSITFYMLPYLSCILNSVATAYYGYGYAHIPIYYFVSSFVLITLLFKFIHYNYCYVIRTGQKDNIFVYCEWFG